MDASINSAQSRTLLVGGAGYVGSVLAAHLLEHGYAVTCLDRLTYRHNHAVWPFLGRKDYRFVNGDISDSSALARALEGVSHVVMLAGLVGDPITKKYPTESEAINLNGVWKVLSELAGKKLDRVIFVSTCSN